MVAVTYIEYNGTEHQVELAEGETVMQGAINNMIEGIVGECGGGLACATCHCYVDESSFEKLDPASEQEQQMLEFTSSELKPTSRLSCQITISEELDGLVVRLPEAQF